MAKTALKNENFKAYSDIITISPAIIGCIASRPKLFNPQNTAGLLTYDKAFLRGTQPSQAFAQWHYVSLSSNTVMAVAPDSHRIPY